MAPQITYYQLKKLLRKKNPLICQRNWLPFEFSQSSIYSMKIQTGSHFCRWHLKFIFLVKIVLANVASNNLTKKKSCQMNAGQQRFDSIWRENRQISLKKSQIEFTFPILLFPFSLTGARSWLRLKSVSSSTSFPLVSPRSNHSTVTLRVSILIPETTAEWMRPEKLIRKNREINMSS